MRRHGRWVTTWRWRNEPQLETPGLSPAAWGDWLTEFGEEMQYRSGALYTPAPSPGTADWPAWWQATAQAARDGRFDGMDAHVYGWPSEVAATLAVCRQHWPGPLLVSEHNFGAGRQFSLDAYA